MRVFQDRAGRGGRVAGQHRIVEDELVRAVAGQVRRRPDVGPVQRQQERRGALRQVLQHDSLVERDRYVDHRAGGVRAAARGRGHAGDRRRREPDKLDGVVVRRGGHCVRAAARVEHVDAVDAKQGVEPADPVPCRSRGYKRSVPVDAGQLEAVVAVRGRKGVHAAAHPEHGYILGKVKRVEPVRAVRRRASCGKGAVRVDADQLEAVVGLRGRDGIVKAAHLERGHAGGAAKCLESARPVRGRAVVRYGAVRVDADQLEAAGLASGYNGAGRAVAAVPAGPAAVRSEHVYVVGSGEYESAGPVGGRAVVHKGAVREDADQLEAVVGRRGHNGAGLVASPEHGRAGGARQLVKPAIVAFGGRAV